MSIFPVMEILASLVETFWGVFVPVKVLGDGEVKWKESGVAVIILTGLVWFLNQHSVHFAITSSVGIITMTLSVCIICKSKLLDVLALIVFYLIVIYIFDFLTLSLFATVQGNTKLVGFVVAGDFGQRIRVIMLSKTILSLSCCAFLRFYRRVDIKGPNVWLLLILGIGIIYYLVNSTLLHADINMFIIWFFLLVIIILGTYIAVQYLMALSNKEHKILEDERNRMLAENYDLMVNNYRNNRIFYHDLKNQYSIIKNHLDNGEYEKAKKYMENLKPRSYSDPIGTLTGVESLDILIEDKKSKAERLGISVNILAEPIQLKLTDYDMVALVGNVFDNAIEACRNVDKAGWIQVIIRKVKNIIFIKLSNSCAWEPEKQNGIFVSKKENKDVHGLGLCSVKAIVEKYNGVFEIDYRDEKFSIVISFFD